MSWAKKGVLMVPNQTLLRLGVAAIALAPATALALPAPAFAQAMRIDLPAMPLDQALDRIEALTGVTINADPDAIDGVTSAPVLNAPDAFAAVRQAIGQASVAALRGEDGSITVVNDIVVVAQRDEAETDVLVDGATSSSRTGETLRDQPRNTQVISAKLLADQQAQTLPDALRNAGGVTVNTATVQGGVSYSVRGFNTGGAVNGLPTPSSSQFAAGSTQPIANVERLEVLKGPDAILLGGGSLGGTVNIVTKKPSAQERLYVSAEAGSYGMGRITVDANNALTDDKRLSGRIIATASDADRNFGGYRGTEDYLFAPSLRYKDEDTDFIASISAGDQIFGMVPYTIFNPATGKPYEIEAGKPIVGDKNQYIRITSTIYDLQVEQEVAPWLTLSAHGQHQDASVKIRQYSPFVVLSPDGLLLLSSSGVRQANKSDVIDGYARFEFETGPVEHKLIVGGMYYNSKVEGETADFSNGGEEIFVYNFLTGDMPLPPLPESYNFSDSAKSEQTSYYAQYLAKIGRLAVMASVRKNDSNSVVQFVGRDANEYSSNGAVTPTYGAMFDITDNLSVYGLLAYGFIPNFRTDRFLELLPDTETRNIEGGIKLDLFRDKVLLSASYFNLRQSNIRVNDPVNPFYEIALPGQVGEGLDVSITGEPLEGWQISGSYTRTEYSYLEPEISGTEVIMAPRDQYSLYTSYRHKVSEKVSAGLGAGVFGRSKAAVDRDGNDFIGATNQVDANAFLTVGPLDLNFGVRNLFDRLNYGVTPSTTYVPIGEPRSWRLTVGYRFF